MAEESGIMEKSGDPPASEEGTAEENNRFKESSRVMLTTVFATTNASWVVQSLTSILREKGSVTLLLKLYALYIVIEVMHL